MFFFHKRNSPSRLARITKFDGSSPDGPFFWHFLGTRGVTPPLFIAEFAPRKLRNDAAFCYDVDEEISDGSDTHTSAPFPPLKPLPPSRFHPSHP